MRIKMLGTNLMVASAVGLFAVNAVAQDAPPPPESVPPTASGAPVAPAPTAAAEAPSTAPVTGSATLAAGAEETGLPAPGSAPAAAEPPADEPSYPPAWFRIDSDGAGLQLWAGATHPLSDTVGLATDMYVTAGNFTSGLTPVGEFDIGPAITAGPLVLTPMLGIVFDWSQKRASSLVPQFYAVGGPDPIYFELWAQMFLNTVFVDETLNQLYLRFFIDYEVSDYFAIGPQIEATLNLNGDDDDESVASLPVGGNVMLTNYGAGNTLLLFLGYETKEGARQVPISETETEERALVGRLTFVKNF